VIALAVALRHSWRQDGLTRLVRSLRITTASSPVRTHPRRRRPANTPHNTGKSRKTR
jgi:hypothetical protein